jgi:hypothetical protein
VPRAAHDRPTSRNDGRAGGDVEVGGEQQPIVRAAK